MKYLIFGLGNPGPEYYYTRHNVGFMVLDYLSQNYESSRYALVSKVKFKGRTLILVKPQTYMNLSGKAVAYYVNLHKVPLTNVLVVYDDISLPFGTIRIRKKGSDGGHNGLKDIIRYLNTTQFPRMRIGIKNEENIHNLADFVLSPFSEREQKLLQEKVLPAAANCIKNLTFVGIDRVMSECNRSFL